MLTERKIINALVFGSSLFIAPFLIGSFLTDNPWPLAILAGLTGMMVCFVFFNDRLALFPLLGLSVVGNLNFLPLKLDATHVFSILLILYFVTTHLLLRRRSFKRGRWVLFVPIALLAMIVLYHDHQLGLRMMGSETEGDRRPFLVLLEVLTFFCGINVSSPPVGFMRRLPIYGVVLTFISSMPFVLTTYFPSTAPYLYHLTDSVNKDVYIESVAAINTPDQSSNIGRMGVFASIALALQVYLISYFPLGTWWWPKRWLVPAISLGCLILTCFSGFRNNLAYFGIATIFGTLCYHTWRAFLLPVVFAALGLFLLVGYQNNLINLDLDKLPLIVQRTMAFLPGKWDTAAMDSAATSSDWRQNIIDVYIKEYAKKSPWLGNGYSFDSKQYDALLRLAAMTSGTDSQYYTAEAYIIAKMPHTGWISVYDAVGLIGSVAFVLLGIAEIFIVGHFVFAGTFWGVSNRDSPLFPLYTWLFCTIATQMVCFFTTFGDFGTTYGGLCLYGIALSQLDSIRASMKPGTPSRTRKEQMARPVFTGVMAGAQPRGLVKS